VRSVERLPTEEERIRSVRPMSESDLLDALDAPDAPAAAGDSTVPYAAPKEVAGGAAAGESPPGVRNVVPLRDDTVVYSDRTRSARPSFKI